MHAAHIALICFDLTDGKSFNSVEYWAHEVEHATPDNCLRVLVGMKADLKRVISTEQGHRMATIIEATQYYETSAKSDMNVAEMIDDVVKRMFDNLA